MQCAVCGVRCVWCVVWYVRCVLFKANYIPPEVYIYICEREREREKDRTRKRGTSRTAQSSFQSRSSGLPSSNLLGRRGRTLPHQSRRRQQTFVPAGFQTLAGQDLPLYKYDVIRSECAHISIKRCAEVAGYWPSEDTGVLQGLGHPIWVLKRVD